MILKNIYKLLIFISLYNFTACSCTPNEGPCEYVEEKFNMRVIDVLADSTVKNGYIVLVDFDGNVSYASGTHTLAEVRNVVTDVDFVAKNHIEPGIIYTGVAHIKVSGSGDCEEEIIQWNQKLNK